MDKYNIARFLSAQDRYGHYATALQEVRTGRKTSHWVWFVFPQMQGLGMSAMSQKYGIASLDEAKAYYANTTLRRRLREITEALLQQNDSALAIFGGIDAMKVQSSMTLFELVAPDDIFTQVLDKFYDGKRCQRTLNKIS